jgi:hypothetical protein
MRGEVKREDVRTRNLGKSRFAHAAERAARIALYITLRNGGHGPEQAAEQVGVRPGDRTAAGYEREFWRASRGR